MRCRIIPFIGDCPAGAQIPFRQALRAIVEIVAIFIIAL